MNIALFGASGAIGSLLLKKFLENGDTVYAYVRNPDKITIKHAHLHIIEGELSDESSIEKAVGNADVIISTLGPSMKGKRNDMQTPIADGHALIMKVMERQHKLRLITLATPSLKAERDPNKFMLKVPGFMAKTFLPWAYRDIIKLEGIIRNSPLDWTVIRIINPNAKTSGAGYDTAIGNQSFKMAVSRENVACFFYDVAKNNRFIHEMPIVFNKKIL